MNVADMSESELLALFLPVLKDHQKQAEKEWQQRFGAGFPLQLGPGDDAAVQRFTDLTVSTIDTQTQGQDFRLLWPSGLQTSGYDVGWKAATQNLADVAAMGAYPSSLLVSLSLTPDTPAHWVRDFARGLCASINAHAIPWCTVAGGDLGRATEISVTVAAQGTCAHPVLRSGAHNEDVLAYSGEIGTAAAGLALLESTAYQPGKDAQLDSLVAAQQRPIAAVQAGIKANYAHAMMDISDGLLRDAERLAQASAVAINIDVDSLAEAVEKIRPAAEFLVTQDSNYTHQVPQQLALHWCLTGGENHGMLAAFASADIDRAKTHGFLPLGKIEKSHENRVSVNGKQYRGKGWDHFEA